MLRRSVAGSPPYPLINSPMFNAWAIAVERGEKRLILTKHFDVFLDKRLVLCMKESTDFPLVFTIRKRIQFSSPWYNSVCKLIIFICSYFGEENGSKARNLCRSSYLCRSPRWGVVILIRIVPYLSPSVLKWIHV